MEVPLFGLFFYYAAAVMAILVSLTTMVAVATITVYGLSYYSFSVAVAAEVVAVTVVSAKPIYLKKATESSVAFILYILFYFFICMPTVFHTYQQYNSN